MRKHRLNHYKAMVALFVRISFRNIRSIAKPKRLINLVIDIIGLVFPGANLIDLQFTYKYLKALIARKAGIVLDQLKEKIAMFSTPHNSCC